MEGRFEIMALPEISREQFRRFWATPKLFVGSADAREQLEKFVGVIDVFYELRFAAQERFACMRHLAKDKNGALPLPWCTVEKIILDRGESAPKRLVVQIAHKCFKELATIAKEPKRVLRRERRETNISKIQQIDSVCMHKWGQRPGRNSIERAGVKQALPAVVRRENFDVPENRVVKDFVSRTEALATRYLTSFGSKIFKNSGDAKEILSSVKRLRALCEKILEMPEFATVKMPHLPIIPNYTLRENVNYSRVWHFYREILNEAAFAENLWSERVATLDILGKIHEGMRAHLPQNERKFYSELWINPQNAQTSAETLLDNPLWKNAIANEKINPPRITIWKGSELYSATAIFDLEKLPWQILVESSRHKNAKKYLHKQWQPNVEDFDAENGVLRAGTQSWSLKDILKNNLEKHNEEHLLRDFFEQLYGELQARAKEWLIIVPDSWDAEFLERILAATPHREKVFLLWRSVATALGEGSKMHKVGDEIKIPQSEFDFGKRCEYCAEWTTPAKHGRRPAEMLLPWRHRKEGKTPNFCLYDVSIAVAGACKFLACREREQVAYYDELEAMYLVVQRTETETIGFSTLVEHKEKWEGGEKYTQDGIDGGKVSNNPPEKLSFYLLWTNEPDEEKRRTKLLKCVDTKEFECGELEGKFPIKFSANITPGQGLAQLSIVYAKGKPPLVLEYSSLENTAETVNLLEGKLKRSFPPVSPRDLCNPDFWQKNDFIESYRYRRGSGSELRKHKYCFKNGSPMTSNLPSVPEDMSPLEFLRWQNVFGNAARVPANLPPEYQGFTEKFPPEDILPESDRNAWFKEMAEDYFIAKKRGDQKEIDRIVNWIAWTYSDSPVFDSVRNDVFQKVRSAIRGGASVKPQYYTFCSNVIYNEQQLRDLLKEVRDHWNENSNDHMLRFFSNILMFYENILETIASVEPWEKFNQRLVEYLLRNHCNHRNAKATSGYILKSLLFLLRLRLFKKSFLKDEKSVENTPLKDRIRKKFNVNEKTPASDITGPRVVAYLKYLAGSGTIADLPVGD